MPHGGVMGMRENTALAVYLSVVRELPVRERLRLARLIMDDLADTAPTWTVDDRDEWSGEDIADVQRAAMVYAGQHLAEDDDAEPR